MDTACESCHLRVFPKSDRSHFKLTGMNATRSLYLLQAKLKLLMAAAMATSSTHECILEAVIEVPHCWTFYPVMNSFLHRPLAACFTIAAGRSFRLGLVSTLR